jgi:hypothetical protein
MRTLLTGDGYRTVLSIECEVSVGGVHSYPISCVPRFRFPRVERTMRAPCTKRRVDFPQEQDIAQEKSASKPKLICRLGGILEVLVAFRFVPRLRKRAESKEGRDAGDSI